MSGELGPSGWLQHALATHPRQSDPRCREEEPAEVLPGDVCVVGPMEPVALAGDRLGTIGHLFVVVEEAEGEGRFIGMLATAETELATEVDAILEPECSGLGYEIAVLSRYFGHLWTVQVRRRVGAVEESVLGQLDELSHRDEPIGVTLKRGLPLQPEGIDPRYPALRVLSEELDSLTDHCRRRLHDLVPVLDPALAQVLEHLLAEPGVRDRTVSARASVPFRDGMLEAFGGLTTDQKLAALPLLESAVLVGSPTRAASLQQSALKGHICPDALARAAADVDRTLPVTPVLTHRKCWRGGVMAPVRYREESRDRVIVARAASDVPLREAV